MTTSVTETPAKSPAIVTLRPQPHGGALRTGGTNRGGPGRPPSAIREAARALYDARLGLLAEIADDHAINSGDRIRALHELARVGMGNPVSLDDVRSCLIRTLFVSPS